MNPPTHISLDIDLGLAIRLDHEVRLQDKAADARRAALQTGPRPISATEARARVLKVQRLDVLRDLIRDGLDVLARARGEEVPSAVLVRSDVAPGPDPSEDLAPLTPPRERRGSTTTTEAQALETFLAAEPEGPAPEGQPESAEPPAAPEPAAPPTSAAREPLRPTVHITPPPRLKLLGVTVKPKV